MLFEVEAEDITELNAGALTALLKQLLHAESRRATIPLRGTSVPMQITTPDGGEDGRVEWTSGVEATDYFPNRFCVFQSKARNISDSTVASELLEKKKGPRGKLNPAILEVVERNGAYVIFCSHAFGGQKIKRLERAMVASIRRRRRKLHDAAALKVYDANKIAAWVNEHPAVALALVEQRRRRALSDFHSFQGWGRSPEIARVPWVGEAAAARYAINGEIRDASGKAATAVDFPDAARAVLAHVEGPEAVVRVAGPSGFGKSRFVYEVFNLKNELGDAVCRAEIVYVNVSAAGEQQVLALACEIADAGFAAILVADDCNDSAHAALAETVRRTGSQLRVVTINVDSRVAASINTHVMTVRLRATSVEGVRAIAKAISPHLDASDIQYIEEFADGFPQMAVLAAQNKAGRKESIDSIEAVLERVVGKGNRGRARDRQALESLSLFEWVTDRGAEEEEAGFVARRVARLKTAAAFLEAVKSFASRGILVRRGDRLQVSPRPLAVRLALRRIELLPDGELYRIFTAAPGALRRALLNRLRWLDHAHAARAFGTSLLESHRYGSAHALLLPDSAEWLPGLTHIVPDAVANMLARNLTDISPDELKALAAKRPLISALEMLAFRDASFEVAARLLLHLGAYEEPSRFSNSAAGQFKQLYHLALSGTEAGPAKRLRVLDEGLDSCDKRLMVLSVDAAGEMLDTNHFTRIAGAEEIGTRRLHDWHPATEGEAREFLGAAVERLTVLVERKDDFAARAKQHLGSHLRGLLSRLPTRDIKATIDRIVAVGGVWPKAIQQINEWLYFSHADVPAEFRQEIRALYDHLLPTDPIERTKVFVSGHQTDLHDPDTTYGARAHDFEYQARMAAACAQEVARNRALVQRATETFAIGDAESVFPFARALASAVEDPAALLAAGLAVLEAREGDPNVRYFAGLISGAFMQAPDIARASVRATLAAPKLKKQGVALIGQGKLDPGDVDLAIALLKSNDIAPGDAAMLAGGKGLHHLDAKHALKLVEELATHGGGGLWAALEAAVLRFEGTPPLSSGPILRRIIVSPGLFDTDHRPQMDGFYFETAVTGMVNSGLITEPFAQRLCRFLMSVSEIAPSTVFFEIKHRIHAVLRLMAKTFPTALWAALAPAMVRKRGSTKDYMFEILLDDDRDNGRSGGLLGLLPPSLYIDRIREDPAKRAPKIVAHLPLITLGEDPRWNENARSLIDEFGEIEAVRAVIEKRLCRGAWWDAEEHFRVPRELMQQLERHRSPIVRQWARSRARSFAAEMEKKPDASRVRLSASDGEL